jgi:hypothetical protein
MEELSSILPKGAMVPPGRSRTPVGRPWQTTIVTNDQRTTTTGPVRTDADYQTRRHRSGQPELKSMRHHFSADKSSSESSGDDRREKTPFERGQDLHREKMQRDGESWGDVKEHAPSSMQALASSLSKRDDDSSFDGDFPPLQRGQSNEPDAAYNWMKSQGLGSKRQRQKAMKRQKQEIEAQRSTMFVEDMSEKWEAAASAGKPAQRQSQEEQALQDAQMNHTALRAKADALSKKLKHSKLAAEYPRPETNDDVLTPDQRHEQKKRLKECREAVAAMRQAEQAEKDACQAQLVHLRECREDVIAKRARNPDWDPEFDDHDSDEMVSDNEGEDYDSDSSGGSQRRHEALTELQIKPEKETLKLEKSLTYLLRHDAERRGCSVRSDGLVKMKEVCDVLCVNRAEVHAIVIFSCRDNQPRFELIDHRVYGCFIRATYKVSFHTVDPNLLESPIHDCLNTRPPTDQDPYEAVTLLTAAEAAQVQEWQHDPENNDDMPAMA